MSFLDAVLEQFANASGGMAEALGIWGDMLVAFAAGGIGYWALRRMRALKRLPVKGIDRVAYIIPQCTLAEKTKVGRRKPLGRFDKARQTPLRFALQQITTSREGTMRKLALFAFAAVVATTGAQAAQIVTKYSGIQPNDHPSSYAEEYFGEEVGTLTKGAIKVEVYHNTQLGDAVANVQSIRNGTIGFTTVSASNLNQVVPAMDMYSLPFLFKNADQFWWFLAQPEAAALAKPLEDKGIKVLGYLDSGARNLFTDKPVHTPADMAGQKIRVMASPVMVNSMKALGATGVPVAWSELYTALQTGVVDGAENNHPSVVAKKFYEVSKYYTLDEHMRIPDVMIMSMKLYKSLTPEQQKAVEEAGQRAQAYMRGAWHISEVKDLQELKSKFKEIITPDKAPFVKAVGPMVSEEAKRLGVEKTVAFILDSQKNF